MIREVKSPTFIEPDLCFSPISTIGRRRNAAARKLNERLHDGRFAPMVGG
jgi:hypothetical protein